MRRFDSHEEARAHAGHMRDAHEFSTRHRVNWYQSFGDHWYWLCTQCPLGGSVHELEYYPADLSTEG